LIAALATPETFGAARRAQVDALTREAELAPRRSMQDRWRDHL